MDSKTAISRNLPIIGLILIVTEMFSSVSQTASFDGPTLPCACGLDRSITSAWDQTFNVQAKFILTTELVGGWHGQVICTVPVVSFTTWAAEHEPVGDSNMIFDLTNTDAHRPAGSELSLAFEIVYSTTLKPGCTFLVDDQPICQCPACIDSDDCQLATTADSFSLSTETDVTDDITTTQRHTILFTETTIGPSGEMTQPTTETTSVTSGTTQTSITLVDTTNEPPQDTTSAATSGENSTPIPATSTATSQTPTTLADTINTPPQTNATSAATTPATIAATSPATTEESKTITTTAAEIEMLSNATEHRMTNTEVSFENVTMLVAAVIRQLNVTGDPPLPWLMNVVSEVDRLLSSVPLIDNPVDRYKMINESLTILRLLSGIRDTRSNTSERHRYYLLFVETMDLIIVQQNITLSEMLDEHREEFETIMNATTRNKMALEILDAMEAFEQAVLNDTDITDLVLESTNIQIRLWQAKKESEDFFTVFKDGEKNHTKIYIPGNTFETDFQDTRVVSSVILRGIQDALIPVIGDAKTDYEEVLAPSPIISIQVKDRTSGPLAENMTFSFPRFKIPEGFSSHCSFFEGASELSDDWYTRGCYELQSDEEFDYLMCTCNYL